MRVVVDTNVLVSSLMPSRLRAIREAFKTSKFTLVLSASIFNELLAVVNRPKIASVIDLRAKRNLIELIRKDALFVNSSENEKVIIEKDPFDDNFLHAAKTGKADFIVSGNKHILSLQSFHSIPIISPKEFLEILEKK